MTGSGGSVAEPKILITNNTADSRYEISLDGERVGLADYRIISGSGPDVVVIPHTETSPGHGGQGLASALVRFALDDIAAAGRRVRPDCPFVKTYIQRHPEYADLIA